MNGEAQKVDLYTLLNVAQNASTEEIVNTINNKYI